MTFTELIKDFIDTSKERLKTPISGAFLWSFLLYNWRPIFLLLFSDASIEDKIIVVNHEYCNFWALFIPFFVALFYTILVPKLMLQIDKSLIETKEERINNIYQEKEHLVDKKTTLASKEFLLKSAESGNKEIEQLNDEIESLKGQNAGLQESIKQITDSNKITIEELNKRLKIANDTIVKLNRSGADVVIEHSANMDKWQGLRDMVIGGTLHLEMTLATNVINATDALTFDEYMFLKHLDYSKTGKIKSISVVNPEILIKSLAGKNILQYISTTESSNVSLTKIGLIIIDIIKTT